MVVVLTGPNSFALQAGLNKIVEQFKAEHGEFGLEQIDAAEVEVGRLLESVASLPFLASRRMIILRTPSANKGLGDNIEQLLDAVSESTDLIIVEPKFDKRSVLYKTLKKSADFREFSELDERQLATWLSEEAKHRGGKLSFGDASYLIQRAGHNQLMLSNELEKLLIYRPEVSRQTIDLLVEPQPQSSIFDLLEASFNGDVKKALHLYQDQRQQQVEPQAIMAMIAWQLHILAVVKTNQNLSPETIASRANFSPYVVRKTLSIAHKLSLQEVKDLIARALDVDLRLKTENIDADEAVQHLLLSINN